MNGIGKRRDEVLDRGGEERGGGERSDLADEGATDDGTVGLRSDFGGLGRGGYAEAHADREGRVFPDGRDSGGDRRREFLLFARDPFARDIVNKPTGGLGDFSDA